MMRFWTIAKSLRTGIILLAIITFFSILGVIVPQGFPPSSYTGRWGSVAGSMLLSAGFDHIFSSCWYTILLGLFALNILCCTASRFNASVKKMTGSLFLNVAGINALPYHAELAVNGSAEAVAHKITDMFRKKHFSTKINGNGDSVMIDAQRGRLREIGSALLHVSFLPLLAGGLIARLTGFSYMEHVSPGETMRIRDRSIFIRCDSFTIERSENGAVKDYKSGLTLFTSQGDTLMRKVIEVNRPLVYQRLKIYQSSYSADPSNIRNIRLVISGPAIGAVGKGVVCRQGSVATIQGTDISVRAGRFIPDFLIDLKTKLPQSRSKQHNNPAVYVTVWRNTDTLFSGWVFKRFGTMHNEKNDYNIAFISYDQSQTTGLLIKESPGNPVIWFGIIGMSLGVLLVFWVPVRRYWLAVHRDRNGKLSVALGGTGVKEDAEVVRQWEEMQQQIVDAVTESCSSDNNTR